MFPVYQNTQTSKEWPNKPDMIAKSIYNLNKNIIQFVSPSVRPLAILPFSLQIIDFFKALFKERVCYFWDYVKTYYLGYIYEL